MDQSTESNISTDGSFEGGLKSPNDRKLAGSYQDEDEDSGEDMDEDSGEISEEEGEMSSLEEDGEELNDDDEGGMQLFGNNAEPNVPAGRDVVGMGHAGIGREDQLRDEDSDELVDEDDGESDELSSDESDDDTELDSDNEEEEEGEGTAVKLYDPNEYIHLAKEVSPDIQNLFSYILDFQATKIILEPKLLPFIPEYIPAVGELDPFLKPPRPDGKEETLGLHVLDEPCLELSNPTIVKKMVLMKRKKVIRKKDKDSENRSSNLDFVDSIQVDEDEDYSRFEGKIQNWITEIETKLHKKKPTSKITFDDENKKKLPDIESLMKPWDEKFDRILDSVKLPSSQMDLSLEQYARVILALVDIPIMDNNIIQSIRLLFSLYGDFKKNSAFEEKEQEIQGGDDDDDE